jgi:cytochrome c biogenesis protein CcmG, thiol:disulfide interchange protein DsbE
MRFKSRSSASEDAVRASRRALLLAAAGLSLAGLDALLAPGAQANDLRLGKPAPPATLVTLDGKHISTTDLKGSVVILTFWATWCGPCRQELPLLSEYASQHAGQGLVVLGFTLDPGEALAKVQKVAQTLSFPVGLLENSTLPGYGRIWRIPVNFTIDPQGRLIDDGWKDKEPTWTAERLELIVTPLLKKKA